MDTMVEHSLVTDLTGRISGTVLTPRDAGYEAARVVLSALARAHDNPPEKERP